MNEISEEYALKHINKYCAADVAAFVETLRSELTRFKAELADARMTVGFFASVIKSGESWTKQCEDSLNLAMRNGA